MSLWNLIAMCFWVDLTLLVASVAFILVVFILALLVATIEFIFFRD